MDATFIIAYTGKIQLGSPVSIKAQRRLLSIHQDRAMKRGFNVFASTCIEFAEASRAVTNVVLNTAGHTQAAPYAYRAQIMCHERLYPLAPHPHRRRRMPLPIAIPMRRCSSKHTCDSRSVPLSPSSEVMSQSPALFSELGPSNHQ